MGRHGARERAESSTSRFTGSRKRETGFGRESYRDKAYGLVRLSGQKECTVQDGTSEVSWEERSRKRWLICEMSRKSLSNFLLSHHYTHGPQYEAFHTEHHMCKSYQGQVDYMNSHPFLQVIIYSLSAVGRKRSRPLPCTMD